MEEKLVSVIVPVYNVEKYLKRCVDSITQQAYSNLEIVLVDDGSTDNSGAIADECAQNDNRIKVIHQENQGVSVARNKGMIETTGEYIIFVDGDDILLPGMSDFLQNEQCADLSVLSFEIGKDARKVMSDQRFNADQVQQAQIMMLENPTQYMTVWGKIFKRELIKEHHLRFNSELRVAEDGDFMLGYMLACQEITFSMRVGYHYSNDTESVMTNFDNDKVRDYTNAMLVSQAKIKDAPTPIKKAFAVYVLMHLNVMMVHQTFASANPLKYSVKIAELKKVVKMPIFSESLHAIRLSDCHGMRMLPIILIKWHAYHLASILFKVRAKQNESKM
ncbi:glycosyltransferase [Ligilactobacillus cholophilus]|uniref:glycosyltransferase n=1 Tax=Ligilactobacillus cholophilus TaxID=3050131 RepID=UPI0025B142D8|nr:glycosyltransferase [Ligilactobacillus cholophilus]